MSALHLSLNKTIHTLAPDRPMRMKYIAISIAFDVVEVKKQKHFHLCFEYSVGEEKKSKYFSGSVFLQFAKILM